MTDRHRTLPTRSARLLSAAKPTIGLDGTPLRIHGREPLDEAAAAIEDARASLRHAFDVLSAAGLHQRAEDVTWTLDAIDVLRAGQVR